MSSYNVSDEGMSALSQLTALKRLCLQLSDGGVSDGGVRALLGQLTGLESLRLDGNGFKGMADEAMRALGKLTSLTQLSLYMCHGVTDEGVRALAPLAALTYLELSHCGITDERARILAVFLAPRTALSALSLNFSDITDEGVRALSTLTALTYLDLSHSNDFTDEGLREISHLTALTSLCLYDCNGVTDLAMDALRVQLPELYIDLL
jgi:hypothetical protein